MDNHTFDLVKMLHQKLDMLGRMEKYYLQDSKAMGSECAKMMEGMMSDERRHVDMLTKELKSHL